MQRLGQVYGKGGVAAAMVEQPPPVAEDGGVMGHGAKGQQQHGAALPFLGGKKLPPVAAQELIVIFVAVIIGQGAHRMRDAHLFQPRGQLCPHQCGGKLWRKQPAVIPIVVFHSRSPWGFEQFNGILMLP